MTAFDVFKQPKEGGGAHPAFADSGWRKEWTASSGYLPSSSEDLAHDLSAQKQSLEGSVQDDLPVRGVNWYVAFAFCVWDGGRLPTDAEWAYAAFAGKTLTPGKTVEELLKEESEKAGAK